MCDHGDEVLVRVPIPARNSHNGKAHWKVTPVDRCIAPIVRALIAGGIHTSGCCCGHGKEPGNILLHDGRELIVHERQVS